ncbi:group III truncated hemoglobin [Thermomonas brevis]|nr:group III truncated hemoglobin [Thermomonas brevis]
MASRRRTPRREDRKQHDPDRMNQTDASPDTDGAIPGFEQIEALVDRFYDRIQAHSDLGPVFNAAVHDWPAHKRLLTSFWTSVILRAGTYRGNPMAAHHGHPITTRHFVQWLELWRATADELLAPAQAELVHEYASRIGRSLRYGLGLPEPGREPLPLGPRLPLLRGG